MSKEIWRRTKIALDEILSADAASRIDLLAGLDPAVRSEVESLLALDEAAKGFMDLSAVEIGRELLTENYPDEEFVTREVGPYRLVAELGTGGMGTVYLAERADGEFEQRVAVKVLRRELSGREFRRRFRHEREILATLQHPNISRLLDAGSTEDGAPYIVMEYVEGTPFTDYCEEHRLSLGARLDLFRQVCAAVVYAHRNLVVHRDLKPSNILVTSDGVPKLLDFGIAKILSDGDAAGASVTRFGGLTPGYASPEQFSYGAVSTATDVYSLGVILYETVAGTRPFEYAEHNRAEIFKAVAETEPRRPSIAANQGGIATVSPSDIAGDIDNIVLKALRKEPDRRYLSVDAFSDDIHRYQRGLTVSARPATVRYRLGKFVRRNRLSVAVGSFLFALALAGAATSMWLAHVAVRQARFAESEAAKARLEQAKSEATSRFMAKVISYANPAWYAEGSKYRGNARVIDVLDELGDKIDVEFEGEADIQSELHHKFSEVYLMASKNLTDRAEIARFARLQEFHGLRALELRKQYYGDSHELVAKDLFYCYEYLGKTDRERAELLQEAIGMMRRTNPRNLNLPYMLEAYVTSLVLPKYESQRTAYRSAVVPETNENNYEIAERYLREALPIFDEYYNGEGLAIYINQCRLAYVLEMQEKWGEFEAPYAACRANAQKVKGQATEKLVNEDLALVEETLAQKKGSRTP